MLKNTLHQIFVPPTNGKKTNRFLSSLPYGVRGARPGTSSRYRDGSPDGLGVFMDNTPMDVHQSGRTKKNLIKQKKSFSRTDKQTFSYCNDR